MNIRALTVGDIRELRSEPRISDLLLGERLGFHSVHNIRKIIRRSLGELARYGEVYMTNEKGGDQGGRPSVAYHLSEPQALLICMFSRTERAADVREQVVNVFMAWRRGVMLTPPARPETPRLALVADNNAAWDGHVKRGGQIAKAIDADRLVRGEDFARAVAYTPNILFLDNHGRRRRQRRPKFWRDLPVRALAIELHRQMTLDDAWTHIATVFGEHRAPSRSALGRFWMQLDAVRAAC